MRLQDGSILLVDRGYRSFGDIDAEVPLPPVPTGEVTVTGRVQQDQTDPAHRGPTTVTSQLVDGKLVQVPKRIEVHAVNADALAGRGRDRRHRRQRAAGLHPADGRQSRCAGRDRDAADRRRSVFLVCLAVVCIRRHVDPGHRLFHLPGGDRSARSGRAERRLSGTHPLPRRGRRRRGIRRGLDAVARDRPDAPSVDDPESAPVSAASAPAPTELAGPPSAKPRRSGRPATGSIAPNCSTDSVQHRGSTGPAGQRRPKAPFSAGICADSSGVPGTRLGVVSWPAGLRDRLSIRWDFWWQAHLLDCLVDAWLRRPRPGQRPADPRAGQVDQAPQPRPIHQRLLRRHGLDGARPAACGGRRASDDPPGIRQIVTRDPGCLGAADRRNPLAGG